MKNAKRSLILKSARGVLFFFGLPAILFLIAGSWNWWQDWVYVVIAYTASVASRAILTKVHHDLVKERVAFAEKTDTKKWDKILMPLVVLVMPAVYFITAGFDRRFGWSGAVPIWLYVISLFFTLAAYGFSTWALVENRFFSAVVRIQTDRGQTVVDSGPYRLVRHPGYAAGILIAIMFPMMIGSWWSYLRWG